MHSKGVVQYIFAGVFILLLLGFFTGLALIVTVIYLNWPKFVVPPTPGLSL
jgi:hypothetical protein